MIRQICVQSARCARKSFAKNNKTMWVAILALVLAVARGGFIASDPVRGFVDSAGRQRLFHGVNVVYKFPPWLPPTGPQWDPFNSLNDRDFAQLQAWGFNFIRVRVLSSLFCPI